MDKFLCREHCAFRHLRWYADGFIFQIPALPGQRDKHLAFILQGAFAKNQARGLQPLQQRSQRPGIQEQGLAKLLDRALLLLPQHNHNQVLRIC
ncbi:hypothetical protein D3C81_2001610 [compost metagenome]